MAVEQDVLVRINYQLEGIDNSIRTSRQALFTLNALRLSIRDIQQVLSGPSIANILFTAIQLTRTLTQARRLTRALTAEQAALGAQSLLTQFGPAGFQATQLGFFGGVGAGLTAFATANPLLTGVVVGTFAVGAGARVLSDRDRRLREEAREHNRDVAKAQGLEP